MWRRQRMAILVTVAYFTGFNDGKLKANIPALKRQTQTGW